MIKVGIMQSWVKKNTASRYNMVKIIFRQPENAPIIPKKDTFNQRIPYAPTSRFI